MPSAKWSPLHAGIDFHCRKARSEQREVLRRLERRVPLCYSSGSTRLASRDIPLFRRASYEFFRKLLDFAPGGGDFVHVFLIAKERGLGNPNGFKSGAMRVGIIRLEKGMGLGRLGATQPFSVLTVLENVQGVDWRIAGLIGDTLGIHGLNQFFCAGTGELFGVDVKDVGIVTVASAAGIEFLWSDTGNLGKELIEETGIVVAALRLRIEAHQLNAENGTLPLA